MFETIVYSLFERAIEPIIQSDLQHLFSLPDNFLTSKRNFAFAIFNRMTKRLPIICEEHEPI